MNETTTKPPSILDPGFIYVPSDQTDIRVTFQREFAKMRTYVEDDYADVERHHHMMFENGYER